MSPRARRGVRRADIPFLDLERGASRDKQELLAVLSFHTTVRCGYINSFLHSFNFILLFLEHQDGVPHVRL